MTTTTTKLLMERIISLHDTVIRLTLAQRQAESNRAAMRDDLFALMFQPAHATNDDLHISLRKVLAADSERHGDFETAGALRKRVQQRQNIKIIREAAAKTRETHNDG